MIFGSAFLVVSTVTRKGVVLLGMHEDSHNDPCTSLTPLYGQGVI